MSEIIDANIDPHKSKISNKFNHGGETFDVERAGDGLKQLEQITGLDVADVVNPQELLQIFNNAKMQGLIIQDDNGEFKCYVKPGVESKLNLRKYLQVRTQEFKDWFGDRQHCPESASKVVDENGEPLVVFHGTEIKNLKKISYSQFGGGFFFSEEYGGHGDNQYEVFLRIKRGKKLGLEEIAIAAFKDEMVRHMKDGYDGLFYIINGTLQEVCVFNSIQIKSATGNHGRFSSKTDNIYD